MQVKKGQILKYEKGKKAKRNNVKGTKLNQ